MKKINVIIFYLLELISMLSILLLSFFGKMDGDLGLILADEIVYLPVILYVLFTIFLILEGIKNRKVPLSRIITIVIGVLSSIMMYSDSNRISMLNATLFIFSIVLSIMVVVRMLKKIPNSNIEGNLEKTLPEGIFSNKQLILQSISIMIIVVLASIVIILNMNNLIPFQPWISYVILFVVSFIILFACALIFNPLNKVLNKINKELSYSSFKKELLVIKNNKLHPNTINYLNIVLANYTFSYDIDEACNLFEECQVPKNKYHKRIYDIAAINYHINKKEYDDAKIVLDSLRENKINQAIVTNLERYIIVFSTNEEIANIESFINCNNRLNYVNIGNYFTLMYYFNTRNDLCKAKEYANKIISLNSDFVYYDKEANKVINTLELVDDNIDNNN